MKGVDYFKFFLQHCESCDLISGLGGRGPGGVGGGKSHVYKLFIDGISFFYCIGLNINKSMYCIVYSPLCAIIKLACTGDAAPIVM